ncbi:MAG: acyl-CoA/acyl-ACP dehydrogenase [Armatimonadota bacterium]|nr:acyl-CoA/acyl-ACP dehydrogenase [Armatimonadota bacterium]
MDYSLNADEEKWQALAKDLASGQFAPRAAKYDVRAEFPTANFADLRGSGFLALAVPGQYGGGWVGYTPYALAAIEIARGDASTMCMLAMHFGCVFQVLNAGSEEQRERFLRAVVEAGKFFGVATTESSSDVPGTRGDVWAVPCEGGWRLTGRRHFVTGAGAADWLIVRATERDGPAHTFVVGQQDRDGIRVGRPGEGLGLRASATYNVVFEDCFVLSDDELKGGTPVTGGNFYPVAGFSLGLSATVLGPAIAAYDWTRGALRQMALSGGPTAISSERKRLLAEMYTTIEGARSLLLRAARTADHDPSNLMLTIQSARLACAEGAVRVTQKALLACGGRSYLDCYPLERYVRDALAGPLQAGCHETCPERIAGELLKV